LKEEQAKVGPKGEPSGSERVKAHGVEAQAWKAESGLTRGR